MNLTYVEKVLLKAKIGHSTFRLKKPFGRDFVYQEGKPLSGIYLTTAMQIVGTYDDLVSVRPTLAQAEWKEYVSWEAHHVIEKGDFRRLCIEPLFPSSGEQFCVLLPKLAHQERINRVLRTENPTIYGATAQELLYAYGLAYEEIDENLGGRGKIKSELMAIITAQLEFAGL